MNDQLGAEHGELRSEATHESQAQPSAGELRLAQLDGFNKRGEVLPAQIIGRYQAELGHEWAAVYSDPKQEVPPASAEIVLRNPQVYLHEPGVVDSLPDALRQGWDSWIGYADEIATRGSEKTRQWGPHSNGLDKLHHLVESGELNGAYRGAVGDVMRATSDLFAQSVMRKPGNLQYFQGNVLGAADSLEHFRKS